MNTIKTASFDFGNPRDFSLDELAEERGRVYRTVFGRIYIAKAPDDQKPIKPSILPQKPSPVFHPASEL